MLAMFCYAALEIVCYADVERVRAVGEDIDPELVVAFGHGGVLEAMKGKSKRRFPSGMTTKDTKVKTN